MHFKPNAKWIPGEDEYGEEISQNAGAAEKHGEDRDHPRKLRARDMQKNYTLTVLFRKYSKVVNLL